MKIEIDNLEGANKDATLVISNLKFETSLNDIFSTLSFDLPYPYYEQNKIKVFSRVTASSGTDFNFNGIVINTDLSDLERVSLTVVSESFYIANYEELIKIKNVRADSAINQVLTNYDSSFELDSIPLQTSITKIYKGDTIIDIIDDIIKQSEGAEGKKIYRTFENNKLTIFTSANKYPLDFTYSISNLRLSYNGEDIKTRVKVYTEDNKSIALEAVKTNLTLVQKAGVIQKVHSLKAKDKLQADLIAQNILKIYGQIKRTGSFTIFGDYKARVGMSVEIENHSYIISSLSHTLEDEIHLMEVGVILYEE